MNSTELATTSEEGKIKDLIQSDKFKNAVASALPAHLRPERFVRIALTALTRTPKLAQCDQASFFQCLLTLSQFGLEPDGRNAHLIPFENRKRGVTECQLIIDYKGLVDLAMRSGKIAYIHADKVCQNDVFIYDKGEIKKHEVNFKVPRGDAYAYYAIARMKDGEEKCEVMTKEDVQKIRQRSRAKDSGPWVTDEDEMSKKTVWRRLSKWLQLSPEYRDAIELDADRLEDNRFDAALPAIARPIINQPKIADAPNGSETEKEKTRRTRKPKEPEAANPTVKTADKLAEIEKRLTATGYTTEDFVKVATAKDWIDKDTKFSEIDEEKAGAILENWSVASEEIDKALAALSQASGDALFV